MSFVLRPEKSEVKCGSTWTVELPVVQGTSTKNKINKVEKRACMLGAGSIAGYNTAVVIIVRPFCFDRSSA